MVQILTRMLLESLYELFLDLVATFEIGSDMRCLEAVKRIEEG